MGEGRAKIDDVLEGAIGPILILLAFAALFGAVAVSRFRWEES